MMKRVLATGFAAVAAALALGYSQPAQAQTRCQWVGRQMQCQNDRSNNNYGYYNPDRNRNNQYNTDRGYYEEWRRQNHYDYNSDRGYYEEWQRNNQYYGNRNNGYYRDWRNNNQYYGNRANAYNDSNLRRSINEIYRQELGRNADWEGTQHYINQYQNGWSLGQIRNDIANSREARYRYHQY
jgi:hypothetical protein